ncbi:hypothetical protein DYB36_004901 [Aphanomyces astaci]|uniref:Peptidase A2 domain-containing protein n=1 Tax=Aphanomyces astaci TaxID=112090 RepID=A0A397ADE7_APHAT|nr:hypothetical protein DYB36_004901 [Aphanomyces astaci]
MHVLSMDSLPVFSGSEDNREASYQWMRRYEQLSRLSGWTEQEKIAWFPSYLSKTEWITNPLPKADKYYHMTQEPKEPLKTFFYRFNSAAQSARVEYWKSASILEDHIGRFCMALEDESLGDRLSQMVFSSIDDLDRHLDSQRKNQILRQFKNRQVDTSSAGIRRREMTRDKRPSMERQILLAREDSDYDSPAVTNTPKEQLHHEIYALGGKKEWCSSCSKEHWRVNGECWMEQFCSLCKRNGHPTDKCIKACQFCKPTHNKYERCETREQIISVRTYLEALAKSGKLDDLPNMDRTQATRSTPQALETQVARSSRGTLGDLASTALTPLKKKDMPLDPMALEVQEFLATVAAWKTQQEKRGRKRDLLTCNTSYDPPPLVPRVCFTNSTKSLPEEFDLLEGEQLGFWRKSDLSDRARSDQAFLDAAIMNVPARILADTGANLSVIHRRMAERLNLKVDTSKRIGINGLGPNSVSTFGMVTIKLTIARGIVFIFSLAVCDIGPVEFEMILGMDFMSKAGFVIDTGNREIQLPDGEYVPLLTEGIKYETSFLSYVKLRYTMELGAGEFMTMDLPKLNDAPVSGVEYWVDRSARWVPSMCADSHGVPCAYKVTNISNKLLTLSAGTIIGAVAQVGVRPLNSRMVRTTSNRYKEWQVDVWEGSVSCKIQRMLNQMRHFNQAYEPPSVVHPSYPRPTRILRRGNQEGSAPLPSITEADSDAEDANKRDMRATSALPPNPAASPCPVLPGHPGEAGQVEPVLTMDALTVAPDDAIFSTTQQVPPTSDLDDSDPDDSTFITQAFTLLDCFPLVEHDTKPPSHDLSLDEHTPALATSWWTKLSMGQSLASAFAAISSILLPHTTPPSTDRKQGQGIQGDHHDGNDPIPVDVANCLALAAQSGQGGGCAENKSEDFPSSVTAEPIPAEEPGGPGSPRTPGIPGSPGTPRGPIVFAYHQCDVHLSLCCPSIFSLSTSPDTIDQSSLAPEVVVHEGVDMSTEEMSSQLSMIPEIVEDNEPFDITQLDIGELKQVTNPAELLAVQLKNKLPALVQQKCQGVSHDTITEIVFESLRHICSQIEWDTEGGECASTMPTSSATDMLACLEPASSAQTIKGGGSSVFLAQDKATTAEDNPGDPEHPASSGDPGNPGDPDGQNFATKNSPYHPGNPGNDGQGNPADDPALIMQRDIFVAIIRDNMEALQRERLRVISEAQDQEIELSRMKDYLRGNVDHLTPQLCQKLAKHAYEYELGEEGALYHLYWRHRRGPDKTMKWAVLQIYQNISIKII